MVFRNWVRTARRWYFGTSERALDEAYRAALLIRAIENEHFSGQPVCSEACDFGDRVVSYFEAEVKQNLKTVKIRLAEFQATRAVVGERDRDRNRALDYDIALKERAAVVIEKLNFIDEVIQTYEPTSNEDKRSVSLVKVTPQSQNTAVSKSRDSTSRKPTKVNPPQPVSTTSASNKTGAVPRSILNTFSRVFQEVNTTPESETEVIQNYRQARDRTKRSVKFLLLVIIVPLLTHQLTKTFVIAPLVEQNFFKPKSGLIFLNKDLKDEAFEELEQFEKDLHFSSLLGLSPEIAEEEVKEKLHEKAIEISEEYRHHSTDAISNVFADLCSLIGFAGVVLVSQEEVQILKSFLDEIIYGLSDSAKAFLIILFTDMFVGFHSPHGWEVILEGISRHFGLPESRDFNFLFIATFPVILDTVLKYWIFRYLNRISPSAVSTYKTMNE